MSSLLPHNLNNQTVASQITQTDISILSAACGLNSDEAGLLQVRLQKNRLEEMRVQELKQILKYLRDNLGIPIARITGNLFNKYMNLLICFVYTMYLSGIQLCLVFFCLNLYLLHIFSFFYCRS